MCNPYKCGKDHVILCSLKTCGVHYESISEVLQFVGAVEMCKQE